MLMACLVISSECDFVDQGAMRISIALGVCSMLVRPSLTSLSNDERGMLPHTSHHITEHKQLNRIR